MLAGRPSLRTPTGERELDEGEVVAFPVGEDGAHQVVNRGEEPARFLIVSEMNARRPERLSGQRQGRARSNRAPGGRRRRGTKFFSFHESDAVDYLDDEPNRAHDAERDAATGDRGVPGLGEGAASREQAPGQLRRDWLRAQPSGPRDAVDYWEGEEPLRRCGRRVGVAGAGTMGAGIAQLACLGGFETFLHDPDPEALATGARAAAGRRWRRAPSAAAGAPRRRRPPRPG